MVPAWNLKIQRKDIFGISFEGQEIFKNAVKTMARLAEEALEEAGLSVDDIDLCIPHQLTKNSEATAKRCSFPMEKMVINLDQYGNTSAGSIPIALTEALDEKKVKPNSKYSFLLLEGDSLVQQQLSIGVDVHMP